MAMWGNVVSFIGLVYYVVWAAPVNPISPGLLSSSYAPFPSQYISSCNCITAVASTPRPCPMCITITTIGPPPIYCTIFFCAANALFGCSCSGWNIPAEPTGEPLGSHQEPNSESWDVGGLSAEWVEDWPLQEYDTENDRVPTLTPPLLQPGGYALWSSRYPGRWSWGSVRAGKWPVTAVSDWGS